MASEALSIRFPPSHPPPNVAVAAIGLATNELDKAGAIDAKATGSHVPSIALTH